MFWRFRDSSPTNLQLQLQLKSYRMSCTFSVLICLPCVHTTATILKGLNLTFNNSEHDGELVDLILCKVATRPVAFVSLVMVVIGRHWEVTNMFGW